MILLIVCVILVSALFGSLAGSTDGYIEKWRKCKNINKNLNHTPRLLYRTVFSLLIGFSFWGGFDNNPLLFVGYISALSFVSVHIPFDIVKNGITGKDWYYMGITSRYDRFCNYVDSDMPGLTSLFIEVISLLILILMIW